MAITDGNDSTEDRSLESDGQRDSLETVEVLDADAGLTMDARGPRSDRWPANDVY